MVGDYLRDLGAPFLPGKKGQPKKGRRTAARYADALQQIDIELLNAESLRDEPQSVESNYDELKTEVSRWKGRIYALVQSTRTRSAKRVEECLKHGRVQGICVCLHGLRADLASRLQSKARARRSAEAEAYRDVFRSRLLRLVLLIAFSAVVLMVGLAAYGVLHIQGFSWDLKADMRKESAESKEAIHKVSDDYKETVKGAQQSIQDKRKEYEAAVNRESELMKEQTKKLTEGLAGAEKRLANFHKELLEKMEQEASQWRPQIKDAVSAQEKMIPKMASDLIKGLEAPARKELEKEIKAAIDGTAQTNAHLGQINKNLDHLERLQTASAQQAKDLDRQLELQRTSVRELQAAVEMKKKVEKLGGLSEVEWIIRYWWYTVAIVTFSAVISATVFLGQLRKLFKSLTTKWPISLRQRT